MSKPDGPLDVQELHYDLGRKHRNVGTKVEAIWRQFTPEQRAKAMKESTGDGKVLKHSRDRRLGPLYIYIPEYNLQDMTSKPDHFLNIFKFRALTPLYDQLYEGVSDGLADRELMEKCGMRYQDASLEEKTIFLEGELYGQSLEPGPASGGRFPGLPSEQAKLVIIPRTVGELILIRQQYIFQFLNHIIEEILDLGSETRKRTAPEKQENKALVSAVSNLKIQPKSINSSLLEIRTQASDSKAALEDYLHLLRTEPVVLNDAVNFTFVSRAELVPDDRGRILPVFTDRYLSAAFFESVTTAVKAIAIWNYILHLLQLYDAASDKVRRSLITQELANTFHLEYSRTQENFKRKVAPMLRVAGKRFKRITDKASGHSKIFMKGQPAECTISDPQLHYILRLCHPDTNPAAAVQWVQKLGDHNSQYSDDRERLSESELDAFDDLAMIVSFMHITSTTISMAPISRKSGLLFTARAARLESTLDDLKPKADFGDHLVPMDNLLEPQVNNNALTALDDFITRETGSRLGSLYENIVEDSLKDLGKMCGEAKARLEAQSMKTTYVPLPMGQLTSDDALVAHRKTKEKVHPIVSSIYAITGITETPQIVASARFQQYKVKATTASLFAALFSRSEARGSIAWTDFESAMADLEFSVTPRAGSRIAFNPPPSIEGGPAVIHRPHTSGIEGSRLLNTARTLQRVYGWTAGSFVVA